MAGKPAKLKQFDETKVVEELPEPPKPAPDVEDPFRTKPEADAVAARAKEVAEAIETILEKGAPGPRGAIKRNLRSYSFEEGEFCMHYTFVGTKRIATEDWREKSKTVERQASINIHPSISLDTILNGLAKHMAGSY